MSHAVVVEVGAGGESLVTNGTLVRSLTAVDASMCVEGTGG